MAKVVLMYKEATISIEFKSEKEYSVHNPATKTDALKILKTILVEEGLVEA